MRDFYFERGKERIHGVHFPVEDKVASILLIHGISEHIMRYEDFARFLNENKFEVWGFDLRGHGLTAKTKEDLGDFKSENILEDIVGDIREIYLMMDDTHPRYIFGHSMGSFILKYYISQYDDFDKAVFSGTGELKESEGNALYNISEIINLFGKKRRSKLLYHLAVGKFAKAIKDRETDADWISFNEDNIRAYNEDPLCGFGLANESYAAFGKSIVKIVNADYSKTNKDLPLGFFSGKGDPVGNFSKAVVNEVERFKGLGFINVELKLYDNMRHEILNEKDKDIVYKDILEFLMK